MKVGFFFCPFGSLDIPSKMCHSFPSLGSNAALISCKASPVLLIGLFFAKKVHTYAVFHDVNKKKTI